MKKILNNILENSKLAYKKSVLLENNELESLILTIITDTKSLIDKKEENIINKKGFIQKRTEEEEIERVKKKIPSWFKNPNQYNHKILVAYMKLSNNNSNAVKIKDLEIKSNFEDSKTFQSNFNQMKIISYKNHGKVFTENDGLITLWEPVSDFIINEYKKI